MLNSSKFRYNPVQAMLKIKDFKSEIKMDLKFQNWFETGFHFLNQLSNHTKSKRKRIENF